MKGCYICHKKTILQEHHIQPQAYGGKDGPTVRLCSSCHTGLHVCALKAVSKKPKTIDPVFTSEQMLRAEPLIQYIVAAILKSRENPDMKGLVNLTIKPTRQLMQMLHLCKMDAGYSNINDFVLAVLSSYIKSKL